MKIVLWFVGALLLILVLMGVYGMATGKFEPFYENQRPTSSSTDRKQRTSQANQESKRNTCTKNSQPVFSSGFTDLTTLRHIAPIGGVLVGSPARSYIVVKGNDTNNRSLAPLFTPTDATLEGIVFARRDPNNPNAKGEYRLDFRSSCEVTFHFDHLDDVSETIKKLSPTSPTDNTREATRVNLPVKAGDPVGSSDGTDLSGGFDFYLLNTAKQVPHINPKRWMWEQTTIADCPYDYFSPELKKQYYDMFRSQDGADLSSKSCGSPSHDVAGTASGGWFRGMDTDTKGRWLEIAEQNGRIEILVREMGNHIFSIRDYRSTVLPQQLTVGAAACYADQDKWAYVRVDGENQLSFLSGSGSCPTGAPDTTLEMWQR